MRFGRLSLNFLKSYMLKVIRKRRKTYPPHSFEEFINIPFINDDNVCHSYDVYLARKENRKNCCVIDIHGGAYIFNEHQDNYPFAHILLEKGYDVVLLDYEPNDGNKDTSDLFKDVVAGYNHLVSHLKDYGLENDKFVIAGDSAGGHFALLLSELIKAKESPSFIDIRPLDINLIGTVLNCPVYDFGNINKGPLTKGGLHRMLGPRYNDGEWLNKLSPRTYISTYKLPIFLSTCKNDFIREQSMILYNDIKDRDNFSFVDINSDNKEVDHVHNVVKTKLKESIEVNDAIDSFINKLF